jgi:hypothetical protein
LIDAREGDSGNENRHKKMVPPLGLEPRTN